MEKSALAGEGGGCTPTPFHSITIMYIVAVYAPAERADTIHVFHLYPYMYSVGLTTAGGSVRSVQYTVCTCNYLYHMLVSVPSFEPTWAGIIYLFPRTK
jgi:hypothetical protein